MFLPLVFQDMMSQYNAGHAPLEMGTQIELSIVKYHIQSFPNPESPSLACKEHLHTSLLVEYSLHFYATLLFPSTY